MNLKIPEIDSIQKLAHFWDTHDLTDFEDQLEEVSKPVFERETIIKIHLQPDEAEAVKELARLKGVAFTDLIHKWVAERINSLRFSS